MAVTIIAVISIRKKKVAFDATYFHSGFEDKTSYRGAY